MHPNIKRTTTLDQARQQSADYLANAWRGAGTHDEAIAAPERSSEADGRCSGSGSCHCEDCDIRRDVRTRMDAWNKKNPAHTTTGDSRRQIAYDASVSYLENAWRNPPAEGTP